MVWSIRVSGTGEVFMSNITNTSSPAETPIAGVGRIAMLKDFWFYFSVNRGAVIGLWVFIAIVLMAIFAPLIAPHSPTEQFREFFPKPPAWQTGGSAMFLLGTGAGGRDILSR